MAEADDVAIVGMACRFPQAPDLAGYWEMLCAGRSGIVRRDPQQLRDLGVPDALLDDPRFVPASASIDGAELFDPEYFEVSPREALLMNPQHRLFLECAVEAFEAARIDPARFDGNVGVFAGVGRNRYEEVARRSLGGQVGVDDLALELGNEKDYFATRVSYKLGLTGPSLVLQCACSTGLVAVHHGVLSLLAGDSDMVLAGAAAVRWPQPPGYLAMPGSIASPDGRCRPFDARAAGTVPGDGVGAVVLRRLADALADGDEIVAVVRGSAVNNDGAKVGFANVSRHAQSTVVRTALQAAGLAPADIGFVEAHGSGTRVGDAVEWAALRDAFATAPVSGVRIGAVKGNVGHLREAAGLAGLIKAALVVRHGVVPPAPHFESASEELDLDGSPVHVDPEGGEWSAGIRLAGVSSFGMGGTNAHVILEQPPPRVSRMPAGGPQAIVLSSRTVDGLGRLGEQMQGLLAASPASLAEIARTTQLGRRALPHRRCVVAEDTAGALTALRGDARGSWRGTAAGHRPRTAFLFPGLGDQYPGMGAGLYAAVPAFRDAFDACATVVADELGSDLVAELHAAAPATRAGGTGVLASARRNDAACDALADTLAAHPMLVAVEYATATTLLSWGVRPDAMLGHSLGEFVAAAVAGVMAPEDAVRLVCRRAQLISSLPRGAMLAAAMDEAEAAMHAGAGVSVAAVNSPMNVVFSGEPDAVDALALRLAAAKVPARVLPVRHAFHSQALEPVAAPFEAAVRELELEEPSIPYLSNVTGTWIAPGQATSPAYWREHLVSPVRFAAAARELADAAVLVEVGPGSLGGWVTLFTRPSGSSQTVLPAIRRRFEGDSDHARLLEIAARLWTQGAPVDWRHTAAQPVHRAVLPTYPFKRRRFAPADVPHDREAPTRPAFPPTADTGAEARPAESAPAAEHRPACGLEAELADFWQRLLGVENVDRHTSFFEIGGDSLLGTHLIAYLSDAHAVQLPSPVLFEVPTVAGMAAAVEAWRAGATTGVSA